MSFVLSLVIEVVDSITVSQNYCVIVPLTAKDIHQQTVTCTARLALIAVVCTHHLTYISLLYQSLESWEIGFPKVTHRDCCVIRMTQRLWTTMNSIVLCTGMSLEVFVIITLHTENCLNTKNSIHIWVLTTGLLTTSPTRVTEDIHVRTPESKLWIARIVCHAHRNIEHVMVRTVPVCTSLVRNG